MSWREPPDGKGGSWRPLPVRYALTLPGSGVSLAGDRGPDAPPDRALPRPPAGDGLDARDLGRRGLDAAAPRAPALRASRPRALAQVRGPEPDRFLQGPRHDGRDLEGRRGGSARRRLRLHRQHLGVGGGVRGARRADGRDPPAGGRGRTRQARAGARDGRAPARGARLLRPGARRRARARRGRRLRPRQLAQPVPPRGAEDGGLRDRRGARRRPRRARAAVWRRRQHARVRSGAGGARRDAAAARRRGFAARDDPRVGDPDREARPPRGGGGGARGVGRDGGAAGRRRGDRGLARARPGRGSLLRAVVRGRPRGAAARAASCRQPRRLRPHGARPEGSGRGRARHAGSGRGRPDAGGDRGGRALTLRVRAPATTANIGPAFDCAGAALELWNELELADGPPGVEVHGEGAAEIDPDPETHLGVRAFSLVAPADGKRFVFTNRIPLARGLGSSAATIALGIEAAARWRGEPLELERKLEIALELESHADNLAAALAGGVCLTWGGRIARVADTLPLAPVAVVPETRVSTAEARAALPNEVAHDD